MTRDEIASLPLFSGMSAGGLDLLERSAAEVRCSTGQVLALQDDPGSGMYVVVDGTVAVELPGRTIELGAGEFVGELALLVPDTTRVARVRAGSGARCLSVPRETFDTLVESEPAFALAMLRGLARRLAEARS